MGISNPIFVIGNPRSGTTLLRLILTSHSKINIPPECNFIISKMRQYRGTNFVSLDQVRDFVKELCKSPVFLSEKWQIEFENLYAFPYLTDNIRDGLTYPELCAVIYQYYNQEKLGEVKDVWGDKNNANTNYIKFLAQLYPKARFIHIVRDGRAVFSSYKQLQNIKQHKYAPNLPTETWRVAARWATTVSRCSTQLQKHAKGRSLVVKYEDLVTDFVPTVSSICAFLDVPFEASMEEYFLINRKVDLEPIDYEWKKNTRNPVDKTSSYKWKYDLSKNDIHEFENLIGSVLSKYSYERHSSLRRSLGQPSKYFKYRSYVLFLKFKEVIRNLKYGFSR